MNDEIFGTEEAKTHNHVEALARLAVEWFAQGEIEGRPGKGWPVIDFGCGNGSYLASLQGAGFETFGVEGTHVLTYGKSRTLQWDLRFPLYVGAKGHVMCIEVAEHIHAEHHDTVMDTLSRHCLGRLLLTWAVPGQGGVRHVSERNQEQVVPYVARWGFRFREEESRKWRALVSQECSYMKESVYLFER